MMMVELIGSAKIPHPVAIMPTIKIHGESTRIADKRRLVGINAKRLVTRENARTSFLFATIVGAAAARLLVTDKEGITIVLLTTDATNDVTHQLRP